MSALDDYREYVKVLDDEQLEAEITIRRKSAAAFDECWTKARETGAVISDELVAASEESRITLRLAERAQAKRVERPYGASPSDWEGEEEAVEEVAGG